MPAIYWTNLDKRWQTGEINSQENGALQQSQDTRAEIKDGMVTSGCKDSGMECWKKMLCLGIFSTRHKHTTNLCLWNQSVFGVWRKYGGCESNFLQYGIRLCAVTKATVLPLNFSAEKKQYSGCRNWINPEIVCTIFLHPWMGGWGFVGFRLGNWPCKL